jgi:two-component sensor histidine kinase
VLGTVVLGLAFSVVFGTWISRIIEQSRERAQLIERLEAAQAELAEVSRQAGTLAERQRLAGEIHDTLAQGLTSIVMLLQATDAEIGPDPAEARRHVGLATQTAREGLAEARAMVAALTPAHLDTGPLHEALGRLADRIGAELGIAVRFEVCGPARPLPANAEVVLLRAAQEALANVRKHAHASDVRVILSYQPHAVRLDVRDDGAGFDPERVNGGYGLRGMRSRILQVGGSLTDADILRAVEAGAAGYLLKDSPRAEVANAIRAAARGETVLAPSVAARLVTRVRRPQRDSLSARGGGAATGGARHDQRRHRAAVVHQRGDGQDAPAAGVWQARRVRQNRGGDYRDRAGRHSTAWPLSRPSIITISLQVYRSIVIRFLIISD